MNERGDAYDEDLERSFPKRSVENFLPDPCVRCGGPLLAQGVKKQEFIEATLSYTEQTVHICYACGKEIALDSRPYYVL